MTRNINEAGLSVIEHCEGCQLRAYQDVAGIWTIGYGHIRGVTPGMEISQQQAEQALTDDVSSAVKVVDEAIGAVETSDNQFSAMVALCFNIGSLNYRGSSVLREHCAGNFQNAADAFMKWNHAHVRGVLQEVAGLTNRRAAERDLYLKP